ncbi:MAG: hypothetical protein HQK86_06705 [Nitrospinae bacterium]|nr:hypothetical protein [Nitrospinota bacterium]
MTILRMRWILLVGQFFTPSSTGRGGSRTAILLRRAQNDAPLQERR